MKYFAILLADDLIFNDPSATQQLIKVMQETNSSVIGLNKVPKDQIGNYGVVSFAESSKQEKLFLLDGIVEKPQSNPSFRYGCFWQICFISSHL